MSCEQHVEKCGNNNNGFVFIVVVYVLLVVILSTFNYNRF